MKWGNDSFVIRIMGHTPNKKEEIVLKCRILAKKNHFL